MEDIKQELRQDNLAVKSNAIAKLTYVSHSNVTPNNMLKFPFVF